MKQIITESDIQKRVVELADELNTDYIGKDYVVVCVMDGSFIFTADLVRNLTNQNIIVDFIDISSYKGIETTKTITVNKYITTELKDKHVLIVEDIVDTGLTMKWILGNFYNQNPKSIKICSLLDKKSKRVTDVKVDYVGFDCEGFLVGYGLDFDGKFRHLRSIFELE